MGNTSGSAPTLSLLPQKLASPSGEPPGMQGKAGYGEPLVALAQLCGVFPTPGGSRNSSYCTREGCCMAFSSEAVGGRPGKAFPCTRLLSPFSGGRREEGAALESGGTGGADGCRPLRNCPQGLGFPWGAPREAERGLLAALGRLDGPRAGEGKGRKRKRWLVAEIHRGKQQRFARGCPADAEARNPTCSGDETAAGRKRCACCHVSSCGDR